MDAKRNGNNDKEIIARLRDAQVKLLLLNSEEVSASDLRSVIEKIEEAIKQLQR